MSADLAAIRRAFTGSLGNLMILFLPIAVVLDLMNASDVWLFATSALAIVPSPGSAASATSARAVGAASMSRSPMIASALSGAVSPGRRMSRSTGASGS